MCGSSDVIFCNHYTAVTSNCKDLSHSNLHDIKQKEMIQFESDKFLLSATSVEVTFSDGSATLKDEDDDSTAVESHVTLHTSTPLGDELWIEIQKSTKRPEQREREDDKEESSSSYSILIRLIVIPPNKDWRSSAAYTWKLDSAWMSSPLLISTPSSSSSSSWESSPNYSNWLHWNVESYIDSVIQVSNPDDSNTTTTTMTIWECDELIFNFRPLRASAGRMAVSSQLIFTNFQLGKSSLLDVSSYPTTTKEIMEDVKIVEEVEEGESWTYISPCSRDSHNQQSSSSSHCVVVDGKVVKGGGIPSSSLDPQGTELGTLAASVVTTPRGIVMVCTVTFVIFVILTILVVRCLRNYGSHARQSNNNVNYEQVPSVSKKDEDEWNDETISYQNSTQNAET